ncbi:MAG TPA: aminopeptidase N [Micromonosporaceae bacterium]|nr:aminopeptidase N [Micromonosporaceae bacterium]
MTELPSLTREEAEERAAVISVARYDIAVDLTDLAEGDAFRAVSTVRFCCSSPGGSTFVDCAAEVVSAVLNGVPVPPQAITDARITLTGLATENTLVVESVQRSTSLGAGVKRCVDPSDKEVYIWTSFVPDDARRVWACFDQPDLKAPFAFTVLAPAGWTVISNSGDPQVEDLGTDRRWTFPATPPLSTYVPVLNAGPYHQVRCQQGGYDLGLFVRRSLAGLLDRDAAELFATTAAGLAFFGEQFDLPFPQRSYAQVFAPEMGGATENWGCVTWSDAFIYRSDPTFQERETRAVVLLHEMAHMWFGDLVTMRWWDDLWLNESFAEWAAHWAATSATPFTDAWSSFLAGRKLGGYDADRAPITHPIRQPVHDAAEAVTLFDGITYPKGASALKQLVAYVGQPQFITGLRAYFRKRAWGNAVLDDLVGAVETASGRDLSAWTRGWLDTAGTDRLVVETTPDGAASMRATGPNGGQPRPHRLDIGVYDWDGDGLVRRRLVPVETSGVRTDIGEVKAFDLLLVNDEDLTFASTRPDPVSRETLLRSAGRLPSAVARAVAVTTAWEAGDRGHRHHGLHPMRDGGTCLRVQRQPGRAVPAARRYCRRTLGPRTSRIDLMSSVADVCIALADDPARRRVAMRALARTATSPGQLDTLRVAAGDDVDLGWRTLVRTAELGHYDQAEVEALARRDPNPDTWVRALTVQAARPDPVAKQRVWEAIVDKREVPMGSMLDLVTAFWRPGQEDLLTGYAEKFLAGMASMHQAGTMSAIVLSMAMFPCYGVDAAFPDAADTSARAAGVSPVVRKNVVTQTDQLRRILVARGVLLVDFEVT